MGNELDRGDREELRPLAEFRAAFKTLRPFLISMQDAQNLDERRALPDAIDDDERRARHDEFAGAVLAPNPALLGEIGQGIDAALDALELLKGG